MLPLTASPAKKLRATLAAPSDKSISHRALILAAMAMETSRIKNLLPSDDVLATATALKTLGVSIEEDSGEHAVHGNGVGGLRPPEHVLDFRNSGTGARLMLGVLATHPFVSRFTGDESLNRRPMDRVIKPLQEFGAEADAREGKYFPLTLSGAIDPVPIRHRLEVPSAQVKSAVLLAGLNAPGKTTVIESVPTRDHTERMLKSFGAEISVRDVDGTCEISVNGQGELEAIEFEVPGDPSSTAFLIASALIVPNSEIVVENVCVNTRRTGLFTTLKEMGADLEFLNEREACGETVADVRARCGDAVSLQGVAVPAERAASMIDEYPILSVVCSFANGESRMEGLGELRVKESDRLEAIISMLRSNGVHAEGGADSLVIEGCDGNVKGGGTVAACGDHRIAMSALVMGLGSRTGVGIDDGAMIATSFPNFLDCIASMGGDIRNG